MGLPQPANDNRSDFYVYAWLRPCGEVFYIGKGRGNRDRAPKSNNPIFQRIVSKIEKAGEKPKIVRLHENLAEGEAFALERDEIARHGRRNNNTGTLANLTDGGEGNSGWVPSDETRAKISAAHAGKTLSPDHRLKLLEAATNPTPETRAKMSASRIGKKASPVLVAKMVFDNPSRRTEVRAKISAALRGVPKSDEHKAKLSLLASNRSDEHRRKISVANRMLPPASGYKGVSFNTATGRWKVAIRIGDKRPFLGYFADPDDAARAYDRAAIEAWGVGNCYLNFPVNDNAHAPAVIQADHAAHHTAA